MANAITGKTLSERYLAISGYKWDPSAFGLFLEDWSKADTQDQLDFIERARSMPYEAYLTTIYWGILRGWKTRHEINACRRCGRRSDHLHLHHFTYAHRGEEWKFQDDLEVICFDCHRAAHGEADQDALERIRQAKSHRLPCVGETSAMRSAGEIFRNLLPKKKPN